MIQLVDVLEVGAQRLAQDLLAGHDIGQLAQQHVGLGVLEQVTIGAGLEQGNHVLAGVGDGQDHDPGGDLFGAQGLEGIEAGQALHVEIEQDEVRLRLLGHGHGVSAVRSLTYHFDVIFQLQQLHNAFAHQGMVIYDQNTIFHLVHQASLVRLVGKVRCTRVPPEGGSLMVN
ncbi:hypothetical protein D3C77_172030 [compost metagenome]